MTWERLSIDREILERELQGFLPPRIFDAHAHLFAKSQNKGTLDDPFDTAPDPLGWREYAERIREVLPGRQVSGLFFGVPHVDLDLAAANAFVAREARHDANSRAQMLIHPQMDPEFIRLTVRQEGFVGLKCYHVWSGEKPTFNSSIAGFLPEEHVRIAHEEGLAITLHMVRHRALADPANQEALRSYLGKYPRARFILAHAARGFNPYHTIEGIDSLRGFRNVWFDTSAVTENGAFEAIVRTFGAERLLYGSDFPISHMRGRCVAVGDSFLWITPKNMLFNTARAEVVPTLVGIESLRTLKMACLNLRLSSDAIERIFFANAAELFHLDQRAP